MPHIFQTLFSLAQSGIFIVIGLFGIGFVIGFHEFGHFMFCKLFKIATPSFSIGMGPRIFTKKIGETEFSLSAIPVGGYVEIAGNAEIGQGEQKEAHRNDQYSFANKPYYQKMLVMSGGILFNFIFAYFALTMLYLFGMPKSPILYHFSASTTIDQIMPNTPAAQSTLASHDTIIAINGTLVNNAQELLNLIKELPNTTAKFTIERNTTRQDIDVAIGSKECNKNLIGFLGIDFVIPRYGLIKSVQKSFSAVNHIVYQVILAFKGMFTERKFDNLGGPFMIIHQTIKSAEQGFSMLILLLAFISINLAIINIFPLPILDGGQALYYTIEAIMRRPLSERIREYVHYATWLCVLLLVIYLTIKDFIKIFWTC